MRRAVIVLLSLAVVLPAAARKPRAASPAPTTSAALATPAAQGPQRITGVIVTFTAPALTVKTAKGTTEVVTLAPGAKVIANHRGAFNAIKANDFVSVTVGTGRDGRLSAREVRVFPEPMRGTGEGRYQAEKPELGRINATVTEAATTVAGKGGSLKLSFHGAVAGPIAGMCSGHAPAPGTGACTSDAEILVNPATPVSVWELGDASWLEPGKAVSLYTVPGPDGKPSTYGVIVEHNGVKPLP